MDGGIDGGGAGGGGDAQQAQQPQAREGKLQDAQDGLEAGGVVTCWGCSVRVRPPAGAPIFKCGYCGAITEEERPRGGAAHKGAAAGDGGSRRGGLLARVGDAAHTCTRGAATCLSRCGTPLPLRRLLGLVMLPTVIVLIISIIVLGVCKLYPVLLPPPPAAMYYVAWAICITLSFNTFFNYFCACFEDPGYVPRLAYGSTDAVPPLGLDNHFYCKRCKAPKPPDSHHCRASGRCVRDLDHFCPFINNAVGASNRRHFILFLYWAVLSVSYVLALTMIIVVRYSDQFTYDEVKQLMFSPIPLPRRTNDRLMYVLSKCVDWPRSVPRLACLYLIVACGTVLVLVGILLAQQLGYLLSGETYIAVLKSAESGRDPHVRLSWGEKMDNARLVFGSGPVWTWILPMVGQPTGSSIKAESKAA